MCDSIVMIVSHRSFADPSPWQMPQGFWCKTSSHPIVCFNLTDFWVTVNPKLFSSVYRKGYETSFHGVILGCAEQKSYGKVLCWTGSSPYRSIVYTIRQSKKDPINILPMRNVVFGNMVETIDPCGWISHCTASIQMHTGINLSFEIPAERLNTYTCPIEECKPRSFISSCWEKSALELCHGQRQGKPKTASRLSTHTICQSLFSSVSSRIKRTAVSGWHQPFIKGHISNEIMKLSLLPLLNCQGTLRSVMKSYFIQGSLLDSYVLSF